MKVYVSRKRARKVRDLRHARFTVLMHVANTGRGALRGNRFHGGRVIDDEGNHIATVTVNGTVWPGGGWSPSVTPLINADGTPGKPGKE